MCAALVGALGLAACNKSEPPPAPKAVAPKAEAPKAAAPTVNAALQQLAGEVYVYGFPMVLTDATRQVETAETPPNAFRHSDTLPDASTPGAINPNVDFLYSQAWLDLSDEPVILSVPDTKGRYYLVSILDAWTNVANSLGARTTGNEARQFALVGPKWKGTLPEGVTEIRSPTELAWLFGRTAVNDKADLKAAARFQDQITVKTLSEHRKPAKRGKKKKDAAAPEKPAAVSIASTAPREAAANMTAAAFFTRFAELLAENPPAKDDAPMLEKIKQLGVEAGKPFDLAKRDELSIRSVEQGVMAARKAILSAAGGSGSADIQHGWRVDRALGRWGTEYGRRAVAAYQGIGVNAPEDAIFLSTYLDSGGRRLDAAKRYVLHFDKGKLPPTDAFWSLSLYTDKKHFFTNPLGRHNRGSNDGLKKNADGSLDLYLQHADPGNDKEANWLPAPKEGGFNVILRIYWPKKEVIDGHWNPPGIKPAS